MAILQNSERKKQHAKAQLPCNGLGLDMSAVVDKAAGMRLKKATRPEGITAPALHRQQSKTC
ncbi:MAG: hypothetical protein ACK5JO_18820 [Halodesulfovibrio sp.]